MLSRTEKREAINGLLKSILTKKGRSIREIHAIFLGKFLLQISELTLRRHLNNLWREGEIRKKKIKKTQVGKKSLAGRREELWQLSV